MKKNTAAKKILAICIIAITTILFAGRVQAQNMKHYMRMANIIVDSSSLESYKGALKKQMKAALQQERGVIAYAAVYNKNKPTHITILETYASVAAYDAHIKTEHFKLYKTAVAGMVLSLELTDVMPIPL